MPVMVQNHHRSSEKPRVRAAKACKRCSRRKVKCDAIKNGLPCSRCRMDSHDDCALIFSRRGTYDRKVSSRQANHPRASRSSTTGTQPAPPNSEPYENDESVDDQEETANTPISIQDSNPEVNSPLSTATSRHISLSATAGNAQPGSEAGSASTKTRSLAAQFEDFINWQSENNDRQYGLILLGEPSPLTFALEELPQTSSSQLYDASEHIRDSSNLDVIQQDIHPSHLDAADIAYLKAKGCFRLPSERTLNDLVEAFLTRFHPLYSIMNKREVECCHKEKKLPWILIHAICFSGATFCDAPVIHRSEYPSRPNARREFYEKAALLFKMGYHDDKIILLQTVIILSFWGPHMQSYWNPCSWVGFGVTLAVSLGIHRSATSSNVPRGDRGLLRRLWWTLVVRDTYCSVLLGRPFRINLMQSDTGMLTADDFTHEGPDDGFYQTQSATLSTILRDIMHCRFMPGSRNLTREAVHAQLDEWHSKLNLTLRPQTHTPSPPFTCSTTLELLYHYYTLLLYIDNPSMKQQATSPRSPSQGAGQQDIMRSAAIFIASNTIILVTKAKVCNLPHELFPAFFVAGIILYRMMQGKDNIVAQMAQANLDNCRIILNEAQESWDPGHWAMQIFDFLCANHKDTAHQQPTMDDSTIPRDTLYRGNTNCMSFQTDEGDLNALSMSEGQRAISNNEADLDDGGMLFGSRWEPFMLEDFSRATGNYLFMPNVFPQNADGWSSFQSQMY